MKTKTERRISKAGIFLVSIILVMGLAYATTISDGTSSFDGIVNFLSDINVAGQGQFGNITLFQSKLTIIANSTDQEAIELRPYIDESGVVSIEFWDSPKHLCF